MDNTKDCEIVFCNKQTYKFNSKDIIKALKYCEGKQVFGIDTPWGVLSIIDRDSFENVRDAVLGGPSEDPIGYAGDDKLYAV